ncbi:hypothetical protein OsI_38102 [Oryza sativa Indica Group]|uniref:Uncharacterized protein n=1 Tax=Oryza sativa subsp. indica TaxID=39946 RepID=B8BPB1_ORYSI|nr:hypothetical protein OsI_38102 [Oryza sativa Indica Group]
MEFVILPPAATSIMTGGASPGKNHLLKRSGKIPREERRRNEHRRDGRGGVRRDLEATATATAWFSPPAATFSPPHYISPAAATTEGKMEVADSAAPRDGGDLISDFPGAALQLHR